VKGLLEEGKGKEYEFPWNSHTGARGSDLALQLYIKDNI